MVKMELSCMLRITCYPRALFTVNPHYKSFIGQGCSGKMAGYWPCSFYVYLWPSPPAWSINTQKKKLVQYPAILDLGHRAHERDNYDGLHLSLYYYQSRMFSFDLSVNVTCTFHGSLKTIRSNLP